MEVSVTGQALAFLGALALGAGVGLLYDLFRILRVRLPWKALGAVLDLMFWLTVTAALFVYAVAAGDGEVRIYLVMGVLAGAAGYRVRGLSEYCLRAIPRPGTLVLGFAGLPAEEAPGAAADLKKAFL